MENGTEKFRILVAGATGYVGGRLVPRLLAQGHAVRCLARNPEKLRSRNWNGIEIAQGDVLKPQTLPAAFQNIDVAYYLVHSMSGKGDFEDLDIRAARNFGEGAARAGVRRIIYLGGLAKADRGLSAHLRSRQKTGEILAGAGIPVTELRASIIIGSGSSSFEIIRDLVRKLPLMITPRWVRSRCEPIAIGNVIDYLLRSLQEPRTTGRTLEIGGGQVLTYAEMMKQVAAVMGKSLTILPVPVLTPRLSAYWLNLVTTVPMSLAYPLIDGLRNDSVCTDFRIRDWIPLKLTPFTDAVRRALDIDSEGKAESRWTEASGRLLEKLDAASPEKLLSDVRTIESGLPAGAVFSVVQRIGGQTGWYYATWTWKLRGIMDRLIGGVGMRRGRRHPVNLRVGDPVDFWRVEKFEAGRFLRLRAEMKLPGVAWLEFRVKSGETANTVFEQRALFLPSGFFGYLYWYLMIPAHFFIFRNMSKKIVEKAAEI